MHYVTSDFIFILPDKLTYQNGQRTSFAHMTEIQKVKGLFLKTPTPTKEG